MTVVIKASGLELNLDGATEQAVNAVCQQALRDCNYYCKQDTGALIQNSVIHSDSDSGELRWVMPYAERQYTYPGVHRDKNPNASPEWCERAYENHHDEWERVFSSAMNRGL